MNESLIDKRQGDNQQIAKNYNLKGDPYLKSNIFSKLFFYWAFRALRLANKIPLKNEYLGKLEGENNSKNYVQKIYQIWENKKFKAKESIRILKTILSANLCKF
jgi:hypothetical protein